MRVSNTAERLKLIMEQRGMKQVDLLEAVMPICKAHGIKMNRSNISQYVNGSVQPGQDKLSVFSLALGVSETWLMGYDEEQSEPHHESGNSGVLYISPAGEDASIDELRRMLHEYIDSLPDDELRAMSMVFKLHSSKPLD